MAEGLFGLIGPLAASAMNRWGLRRMILAAIALLAISVTRPQRILCVLAGTAFLTVGRRPFSTAPVAEAVAAAPA
jgi:hypothetical protein